MTSTRCAVCNEPRADHGFTAVAGRDGKLGPWHTYTPQPPPPPKDKPHV